MNSRLLWSLVWNERVLEAVLTARHIGIERVGAHTLALIGQHARDALGRYASRCQSMRLIIDLFEFNRELIPEIDPWRPRLDDDKRFDDDDLPVFDFGPVLDAALGGALVAISSEFERIQPKRLDELEGNEVMSVAQKGARIAVDRARDSVRVALDKANQRLVGRLNDGKNER